VDVVADRNVGMAMDDEPMPLIGEGGTTLLISKLCL